MLSSTIRCASRRLSPIRCSPFWPHSPAWLIRKKSGKCERIFPSTFFRKRRSSWAKIGRSACADRSLSQRGSHFNRSRFLLRRSARNAARNKSPRRDHKSAGLAFRHSRKEFVMYFEVHVVTTEFRRKILATAAPHF